MITPFDFATIRLDLAGLKSLRSTTSIEALGPGSEPALGMHVMFVASTPQGEVKTSGVIARVLDDQQIVVDLVYVDDEQLRASFPLLVLMKRADSDETWSIVRIESLFSETAKDSEIESARAQVVNQRFAHLLRRKHDASTNHFSALLFEKDRAWIEAAMEQIETWHRDTARSWPLGEA